MSTADLTEPER